jgi:hypothetical protein
VSDVERSFASFGFRRDRLIGAHDADVVVAVGAFTGEGVKGTGHLDAPAVQVWEFDGDEVVVVEIYADSEAFPGVVTEDERKEQEREEQGDGERENDHSTNAEGKYDGEGDNRDGEQQESRDSEEQESRDGDGGS